MGKIRTRLIGLEEVEKKQKEEQKARSEEKKRTKKELETETTITSPAKEVPKKVSTKKVKARVRGKKYRMAKKKAPEKPLKVAEAIALLKQIKYAGFDESVELHLNVMETGLKGEVELPHSTGKTVRVRIVDDAVLGEIEKGKLDFDILITHPSFMPKLAKYARTLGPKGLMPNPKAGTVSAQPEEVAKKFEKGTLRWKTEAKFPLIHQIIGKLSFDEKSLAENALSFLKGVGRVHIQAAYLKTTMSPSVRIDVESL